MYDCIFMSRLMHIASRKRYICMDTDKVVLLFHYLFQINGHVLFGRSHLNASAIIKSVSAPIIKIILLRYLCRNLFYCFTVTNRCKAGALCNAWLVGYCPWLIYFVEHNIYVRPVCLRDVSAISHRSCAEL